MVTSMDQVKEVQQEFIKKYMSPPYDQYVTCCGISNLRINQERADGKLDLEEGESLEDLCLSVMFREEPSKDLEFPQKYKEIRVFYEVVGEIRPL